MSPLLALNPDRGRHFFQVTYWQTMTSANEITDDVDIIIALSTVADSGFYVDIALYLFVLFAKTGSDSHQMHGSFSVGS